MHYFAAVMEMETSWGNADDMEDDNILSSAQDSNAPGLVQIGTKISRYVWGHVPSVRDFIQWNWKTYSFESFFRLFIPMRNFLIKKIHLGAILASSHTPFLGVFTPFTDSR